MRRVWFVTNPASGSTSAEMRGAIEAAFAGGGDTLIGTTELPDGKLPSASDLNRAGADTMAVYAGDGTINAALAAAKGWAGAVLILPGGTMNLLPKKLHGDADPVAIVQAAAQPRSLPFVAIGDSRAYVAVIIGPATHWHRPRELVRANRFRKLVRAFSLAWRASFARGIRVRGLGGPKGRHQAVVVTPTADALDVAAIDARSWREIARLGWDYATGDWLNAPSVTQWSDKEIAITGRRGVLALVDGEPVQLPPPVRVYHGMSDPVFLTTLEDPA